ncbi:response regulator [Cohnella sp. AR92]|uniref:response regulator n=1 Tax=Cohnella sp. AR92 TaxID=648716 RepID=UPI000F8F14DB|nr:response regulator [Cohnella sp. AR92]RUS46691.1 response regulator [Cohnella sp. AR92]
MHKLMIVEDEPIIRAGLKHYFPWQELGVHEIVDAENGREGVEVALLARPDLVITDIRMPEMDGLEMIERLRGELPDTLFIILTGHGDLQFAQKAIRLGGVRNYLLKPLEYEESYATVVECLKEIESRKRERESRRKLETEVRAFGKVRDDSLFKLLLEEGDASDGDRQERLSRWEESGMLYYPAVLTAIPRRYPMGRGREAWKRFAKERVKELAAEALGLGKVHRLLSYSYQSKLYLIAVCPDPGGERPSGLYFPAGGRMNEILASDGDLSGLAVFASAGLPASKLSEAGSRLRLADKSLYRRYFESSRFFFPQSDADAAGASSAAPSRLQLEAEDRAEIRSCLENGSEADTRRLMNRFSERVQSKEARASVDSLLLFLQELINATLRFAHKHGIPVEEIYSHKLISLAFADDFENSDSLFDWLANWVLELNSAYRTRSSRHPLPDTAIFQQIESFILQHMEQDITLQTIADRFFYNPSYLSRLFKSKLNKNYLSFATEIRIRYAQQCLMDPKYLVTDVCVMCGYKSYKHFVKTFRTVTGKTPTEYRKQLGL